MSESPSEGDEDFKTQTKYKQFSSAVDRALKAFELSTEWHDLISSLARLNKVLLAYVQYPVVPHQLLVCKRLTQCLHPNLPSGVHIKTLGVYGAIFERIGTNGLATDLLAYSSGLFPLITYASMAVRSQVIDIYEKYYVPLGEELRPGLHGMVLGLLPALEDESEHTERVNSLLDAVYEMTDLSFFSSALWQCVLSSPEVRLPAANVILSKLDKKLTAEDQVQLLGGSLPLMVSAICAGLVDKSVLTNRALLDILSYLFPLYRPFLLPSDITSIMVAALETLLKRDVSLNRRLFSWLLGSHLEKVTLAQHLPQLVNGDQSMLGGRETGYFITYSQSYVEMALKGVCTQAVVAAKRLTASKLDCVQPYRLLRALLERSEISDSLMKGVLIDVVTCLREQVEALGGAGSGQHHEVSLRKVRSDDHPKKMGRKATLKLEILQSANLFFSALNRGFLWEWLAGLLETALTRGGMDGEDSKRPVEVQCEVVKNENEELSEEVFLRGISPIPSSHSNLSPISTTFDPEDKPEPDMRQPVTIDQVSCRHVVGLAKFLLKSLPLDSIENAHLVHLPRLSLVTLNCLQQSHSSLSANEIQMTLDLVSCIIHELMSSPSSRASTPSTPLSAAGVKSMRASLPSTPIDAHSKSIAESVECTTDQLMSEITETYLQFFASFVTERVIEDGGKREATFSAACQLLVLLAMFGADKETPEDPTGCSSSDWVQKLVTCCTLNWESHDHHVTFVAMETILKLLQLHHLQLHSSGFPGSAVSGASLTSALITQPLLTHVSSNHTFVRSLTECLWSCLSHSQPSCHLEAATLLSWLHEQLSMSNVCETVVLEHFTCDGLEAYQSFAALWQHSPPHRCGRFLNRSVLRMLEGLKSESPSVRQFVQSWVTFALSREGDLRSLLQPLVKILMAPSTLRRPALDRESEEYRIGMRLSPKDAAKDQTYAKYYYKSLGIPDPLDYAKSGQHCESLSHYSQVIDTKQLLYSLSLLQSVVEVDPLSVVSHMGGALVESGSYSHGGKQASYREDPGKDGSTGKKSLLELIMSSCVELVCSEYPPAVRASLSNHLDNLCVKLSSVELLCSLVGHLTRLLAESQGLEGETSSPVSSSFVSALVTLCDVQKIALLTLGQVVKDLRSFRKEGADQEDSSWLSQLGEGLTSLDPEVTLQSLFKHLLMLVYGLVALETQCYSKQTGSVTTLQTTHPQPSGLRTSTSDWLPAVLPSLPTASQPFFQTLFLDVISDPLLVHLHESLLQLFSAVLPNLLDHQLAELAPKMLKQICTNLEKLSLDKAKHPTRDSLTGRQTALYLNSLCSIISWCLYGDSYPTSENVHKTINPFWRKLRVAETKEQNDTLSPTSRQPSTMSWLFSVFSTSAQMSKSLTDPEGSGSKSSSFSRSRVGIDSRVGQHVLMLLPAVYNAVAEVWKGCGSKVGSESTANECSLFGIREDGAKRKATLEGQEVYRLVSQLVSTLAQHESVAFFSSISHVWMEWNLGSRVQTSRGWSRRKGLFIDLLHHIQALPLSGVIDCVQTTLSQIGLADERQSGLLRQKYLLHFLYKYISSTLQSSEELADCSGQLVTFLREFYNQSFTNTPDYLTNNCHILCMLTSILHVVVCRVPAPDLKKQKKERKELQDVIHKLCEALSMAANVGLPQSDYIVVDHHHTMSHDTHMTKTEPNRANGALKDNLSSQPSHPTRSLGANRVHSPEHSTSHKPERAANFHSDSEVPVRRKNVVASSEVTMKNGPDSTGDIRLPTIQALAVLSNVLSHFVDCAFEGSEKDKVVALLKAVMCNIWPHLHSHSLDAQQSYTHAVKLLSSLSGFQVSRKAWRKEALELFLSPSFFRVEPSALRDWKVVIDNLMTQDHVTFRDLLSRVHPSNTTGVVNIFISLDQEVANGARLLKRKAFALLSAETDQFVEFLPDIQEKLSEYLKVLRHPPICAVVMLVFRVILVRFSPSHLVAFWPAITSEMLSLLTDLDHDLCTEVSEGTSLSSDKLQLYLSVCKLLDTAMALPTDQLPHFQLLRWGFSNHSAYSSSEAYVVTKLCKHFKTLGSPTMEALHSHYTPHSTPPYLQSTVISSLRELKPLFTGLSQPGPGKGASHSQNIPIGSHFSQVDEQQKRLNRIEEILLHDFVEVF